MERRQFLTLSALAAALAAAGQLPLNAGKAPGFPLGLQLFTVRDAMAADPLHTLKEISKMGFQDLELYCFNGEEETYYGFKSRALKAILEDVGLTTSSGHYNLPAYFGKPENDLFWYLDRCIDGAHTLEQRYITWPWLAPQYRTLDHIKRLCELLNRIGKRVTAAGLEFAYHNHGFEFEHYQGVHAYEYIITHTDPAFVKLQLDLSWVAHSSTRSHADWIDRAQGRFAMWHIKDMDRDTRDYTEIGNGSIDFNPILPLAEKAGLKFYYLEQGGNFARNSMQSVRDSSEYFKNNLIHYL